MPVTINGTSTAALPDASGNLVTNGVATLNGGVLTLNNGTQYKVLEFGHGGTRRANIAYDNTNNWLDLQAEPAGSQLLLRTAGIERMRIDASGRVTMPNQPVVSGYWSMTGAWIGSADPFFFNSVFVNNGNHYSTVTGRFTCPVAGYYRMSAAALMGNNSSTNLFAVKNGTDLTMLAHQANGSPGYYATVGGELTVACSANDTLHFRVQSYAGNGVYGNANGTATIELVG